MKKAVKQPTLKEIMDELVSLRKEIEILKNRPMTYPVYIQPEVPKLPQFPQYPMNPNFPGYPGTFPPIITC